MFFYCQTPYLCFLGKEKDGSTIKPQCKIFLKLTLIVLFWFFSNDFICLFIIKVNIRSTPSFFHAHQGEVKQIGPHRQADLQMTQTFRLSLVSESFLDPNLHFQMLKAQITNHFHPLLHLQQFHSLIHDNARMPVGTSFHAHDSYIFLCFSH